MSNGPSPSETAAPLQEDRTLITVGSCNICGDNRGFWKSAVYHPRENYHCQTCGSSSRDRMLIFALSLCLGETGPLSEWEKDTPLTLLETSGYRGHPRLLATLFNYFNVTFDAVDHNGLKADVACLPFPDQCVDVVLSADVFEHVPDDKSGFKEIARVLRGGGYFVLEVPAVGEMDKTQVRVERRGADDVYLVPPEYHAENSLVYRYYGNDLVDELSSLGLSVVSFRRRILDHQIVEQSVLICQKAGYLSLAPKRLSERAWT